MKVSLKNLVMPSCFLAAGLFMSCGETFSRGKATQYCQNFGKTQQELEQILSPDDAREVQVKLDSMAYRDVFNTTKLAKDSSAVAEFNKIAAKYNNRIDKEGHEQGLENIKKDDINAKEYKNITNWEAKTLRQFFIDKFAYRNFFKKNGIMDDNLDKICTQVEEQIKPTLK